jgi:hypothetical protein
VEVLEGDIDAVATHDRDPELTYRSLDLLLLALLAFPDHPLHRDHHPLFGAACPLGLTGCFSAPEREHHRIHLDRFGVVQGRQG